MYKPSLYTVCVVTKQPGSHWHCQIFHSVVKASRLVVQFNEKPQTCTSQLVRVLHDWQKDKDKEAGWGRGYSSPARMQETCLGPRYDRIYRTVRSLYNFCSSCCHFGNLLAWMSVFQNKGFFYQKEVNHPMAVLRKTVFAGQDSLS